MNSVEIDDRELDRLADGELSPAALRDLFARLDQMDNGWKQAALALLEAQALRSACRTLTATPAQTDATPAVLAAVPKSHSGRRELVAVAAALLVTCGLGFWTMQPVTEPQPLSLRTAGESAEETPDELADAVQIAFANRDGEWSDPVTVPVIDATDPAAEAWLAMRPTIPDAIREELAASGKRIREQQTWVPVDLADGRHGLVPVTNLVVTPAELSDYQ